MREFELNIAEGIFKGIRPNSQRERNTERLVECFNVVPTNQGLKLFEPIIDLNASGVTWKGLGQVTSSLGTRTVTINISDYTSGDDVQGVSVYVDGVLKGTTDAGGEITITDVEIGGHTLKLTKTGYVDSDDDVLLNDYFMIT